MNKLLFLIAALLLLPLLMFSQSSNWLSTIDLNISVDYSDRIDLYTDIDGNHIIVQKSNQLVYYLFSATGTQIRTSVRDNNVSEYPRLSRIVAWEGKLYIIYKEGNKIKTQKSTDAGANWSTTAVNEITMNSSTSNGIDAWTDANGVHLVYSEYDNGNSNYKTWYKRNAFDRSNWVEPKEVTDEANVSGGFPSVATSANRVHVTFTAGSFQDPIFNDSPAKTRDRSSGTWQSSQLIFEGASRSMIIANNENLHAFYYDYVPNYYHFDLYYRYRGFESTSWSSPELIQSYADPDYSAINMAVTADDKVHVLYGEYDGVYNVWDDGWGTGYTITGQYSSRSQAIAANSNDIYAVWVYGSTIELRQRDFAPLTPTNLSLAEVVNHHPKLSWDANKEADISLYQIWRKIGGVDPAFVQIATTANTYYVDNNNVYDPRLGDDVYYYVKAVDL